MVQKNILKVIKKGMSEENSDKTSISKDDKINPKVKNATIIK